MAIFAADLYTMKLLKTFPEDISFISETQGQLYVTVKEHDNDWYAHISDASVGKLFPEKNDLSHIGTTTDGKLIFQHAAALSGRKPSINQLSVYDTGTGRWSEPRPADIVLYATAFGLSAYNGMRLNSTGESYVAYNAITNEDYWRADFDNMIRCLYNDGELTLLFESTRKKDLCIHLYAKEGQLRWSVNVDDVLTGGDPEKRKAAIVTYLPAAGHFICCYPGCVLFALDAATGEKKWEYALAMGEPYSVVADLEGLIYITRTRFDKPTRVDIPWLTILNGRSGSLVLEKDLSAVISDTPITPGFYEVRIVAVNTFLYLIIPQLGELYKLDKSTGTRIESYHHTAGFVGKAILQNGHLMLLEDNDEYRRLLMFDL